MLHEVRRRGLAAAVRKIRSASGTTVPDQEAHSVARVIANAGHMTMMEAAKAVNDSIQELAAPLA